MNKNKIIFILISLSTLTASLEFDSFKLGNSESLGAFGLVSLDFKISNLSTESDIFYFTIGSFPLPIFGGTGLTYKKYFNNIKIDPVTDAYFKPYVSTTLFSYYALAFASSSNSSVVNGLMTTLGFGADFPVLKTKKIALNLQTGIYTQFNISEMEVFESPSDQPEIWPTINIKISK